MTGDISHITPPLHVSGRLRQLVHFLPAGLPSETVSVSVTVCLCFTLFLSELFSPNTYVGFSLLLLYFLNSPFPDSVVEVNNLERFETLPNNYCCHFILPRRVELFIGNLFNKLILAY